MRRTVSGISILPAEFRKRIRYICTRSRRHRCERFTKCRTSQRDGIFSSQPDGRKMIAGMSISPWSRRRCRRKKIRTYSLTRRNRSASPPATYWRRFYDGGSREYGIFSWRRSFLWNRLLLLTRTICTVCMITVLAWPKSWWSSASPEVVLRRR